MGSNDLADRIEHTLLHPDATDAALRSLCREALDHGFVGVCVNGRHVPLCRGLLGPDTKVVTVVGFPLGANASSVKALEASQAVTDGADELDMVADLGALIQGDVARAAQDMGAVVAAADGRPVKVIIETALLDAHGLRIACDAAVEAGVAYVKTSTGFAARGASVEDVRILRKHLPEHMAIKASGGIRNLEQALALLNAGAARLGTSAGPAIMAELEHLP